jgi:hypothetical protein
MQVLTSTPSQAPEAKSKFSLASLFMGMALMRFITQDYYQGGFWACLAVGFGLVGWARQRKASSLTYVAAGFIALAMMILWQHVRTDWAATRARRAQQEQRH